MVDEHEVIVRMSPDRVLVTAPTDGDSEHMRCMKLFFLACVARRMIDDSFDLDMANWLHEACLYDEGVIN